MKNMNTLLFVLILSGAAFAYADDAPYESTYKPLPYTNTIFRNANI